MSKRIYTIGESDNDDKAFADIKWIYSVSDIFGLGEKERLYQDYMRDENRLITQTFGAVLGFLFTAVFVLDAVFSHSTPPNLGYPYTNVIFILIYTLDPLVVMGDKGKIRKIFPFHTVYFQGACCVIHSICYGLFLYGMSFSDGCDESPQKYQICNGVLPADQCMIYLTACTAIPIMLKCRHVAAVVLSIAVEIFFMGMTTYRINATIMGSGISLMLALSLQCIVLLEYENFSRRMYLNQTMAIHSHKSMLTVANNAVLKELRATELRNLFGNVAHDLKTPLQAFTFELDAILNHLQAGGFKSPIAHRIERSVEIMQNTSLFFQMVINRALDYSKVSSGMILQPRKDTVSLDVVLSQVRNCLRCFDTNSNVSVEVLSQVFDFIVTDFQWLAENLLCLASNAQKYSKTGKVVIRCFLAEECSSEKTAEWSYTRCRKLEIASQRDTHSLLAFEVIDDGIGFPQSECTTLFEPATPSSRQMGGTGLGLYALKHRVEGLGGSCGVRNRDDNNPGACFWFTIPYAPASNHDEVLIWKTPLASALTTPRNEEEISAIAISALADTPDSSENCAVSILIVDDSTLIRKTASRAFLNVGMATDTAVDGEDCVNKVKQGGYKLILMDIQMPVMDGIESTKRIRQMEREDGMSHVVIIGVSANSDDVTRSDAMAAGMDGFLTKPITVDSLKRCLETLNCEVLCTIESKK